MTETEKQEILSAIKAESQSVDELEAVGTLDGVVSLPTMQGTKLVKVPISLLSAGAESAAVETKAEAEAAKDRATQAQQSSVKAQAAAEASQVAAESAKSAAQASAASAGAVGVQIQGLKEIIEEESHDLSESIKAEAEVRSEVDAQLLAKIDKEAADRQAAIEGEGSLRDNAIRDAKEAVRNEIVQEATDRQAAIESVEVKVSAERAQRESGIANMQDLINQETADREQAISSIEETQTEFQNTVIGLSNRLAKETSDRLSGDKSLDTKYGALADAMSEKIEELGKMGQPIVMTASEYASLVSPSEGQIYYVTE